MPRNRRNILKSLATGLLFSILFTITAMLLMALALVWLRFGDSLITVLNQLIKLTAIILGTCYAVPRGGERGLATGVFLALAYTALGYGMYVGLGGAAFAVGDMLGEMMLGSAAGAVTGAVRANRTSRRRARA